MEYFMKSLGYINNGKFLTCCCYTLYFNLANTVYFEYTTDEFYSDKWDE